MIKTYVKRGLYTSKIVPFIDKDIIKVLTGQRRVGKSYILFQIIDIIKEQNPSANIIYINKEESEFEAVNDDRSLMEYTKTHSTPTGRNYLFIDEVQEIKGFERALRELNGTGRYDIYCTGSNARLLSKDLATLLSGRHIEFEIHSLTYAEFLEFHKLENNDDAFLKYIKYGGLPYLINLTLSDEIVYEYINGVRDTVVVKDVMTRFNIRGVDFLERLIEFLAENIGHLFSAKRISDFLKSQKIKISPNIVLDYISHLCDAFVIYKVQRQDIRGKKIFEVNEKYYFEDMGIRNSIIRYNQTDIGKVLENLVFHHLIALGHKIKVGQLGANEIDFVCEKDGERLYVQVAYLLTSENKEREIGNLLQIDDNYPKLMLSMDSLIGESSYKGIKQENIRNFLAGVK